MQPHTQRTYLFAYRVHPTELNSIVSGPLHTSLTQQTLYKVVTRSSDKITETNEMTQKLHHLFISVASCSLPAVRSQLGTLFTILNEIVEFCRRNIIKTILVCQTAGSVKLIGNRNSCLTALTCAIRNFLRFGFGKICLRSVPKPNEIQIFICLVNIFLVQEVSMKIKFQES